MPVFRLTEDLLFPPARLARPDGLLAVGGDLTQERLLLAYGEGIFPWYSEGDPILWWSPDPRMVLFPDEFHVSRRLRRALRNSAFSFSMDQAFDEVVAACAASRYPGREGTWITAEMQAAYAGLHRAGHAHSVECWRDGALAGGLYGVALGQCFFGESMFCRRPDASKAALACLVAHVRAWGWRLVDCQVTSKHLRSLGAREIARERFLALVRESRKAETRTGRWRVEQPGFAERASRDD